MGGVVVVAVAVVVTGVVGLVVAVVVVGVVVGVIVVVVAAVVVVVVVGFPLQCSDLCMYVCRRVRLFLRFPLVSRCTFSWCH